MVPAVRVVQHLPMNAAGKLDLAALEATAAPRAPVAAAPRTTDEEILSGIFARVLGVPEVGSDDGFFLLGGDSIKAIQVVAAARKRGLPITLEQLVRCRTVRSLARDMEREAAPLPSRRRLHSRCWSATISPASPPTPSMPIH
jgi:aryl carrier-like protein